MVRVLAFPDNSGFFILSILFLRISFAPYGVSVPISFLSTPTKYGRKGQKKIIPEDDLKG